MPNQNQRAWNAMMGNISGANPRRKRPVMQTSTAGMPMRGGEQFENGGSVGMENLLKLTGQKPLDFSNIKQLPPEELAQIAMGAVGGGGGGSLWKILKNMIKKPKSRYVPPEGHGFGVRQGTSYKNKAEFEKSLKELAKQGFAQGGQVPKMEAVKRLVEMWKPKTKEGKLYDDQLARAVMANGGQIPKYFLGGLLSSLAGKGKNVMGLLGGPAGLALSKLFGGKQQQKGRMSAKQLAQQKIAEAQTEGLTEGTQDANKENIMNALMYSTPSNQMNQTNQIPLKKEGMFKQGGKVKYHV